MARHRAAKDLTRHVSWLPWSGCAGWVRNWFAAAPNRRAAASRLIWCSRRWRWSSASPPWCRRARTTTGPPALRGAGAELAAQSRGDGHGAGGARLAPGGGPPLWPIPHFRSPQGEHEGNAAERRAAQDRRPPASRCAFDGRIVPLLGRARASLATDRNILVALDACAPEKRTGRSSLIC